MRLLVRDSSNRPSWAATLVVWVMVLDCVIFTLFLTGVTSNLEPIMNLVLILNSGVLVKFMAREITTKILKSKNGAPPTEQAP